MSQWGSVSSLVKDVQTRKRTAKELVQQSLKTIKVNEDYKAIIATTEERALKRADEIDRQIAQGEDAGRLAGVPFIAKDNFLAFGADTTAASNILKGFDTPYQATAIERLEAEGAICVAKANLDAFAHGSSTENSDFFATHNPHDKTRVPGGSSGGSAAAVVLDMAPFALGTDTGGSIRLPAAFCGAVGYKPTYGLVSRYGVIAMASSTDVIGPLTRSVEDAALVLDVMAGKDEFDSTTIERGKEGYTDLAGNLKGKKIGLIKEYFDGLDEDVKKVIDAATIKLKKAGAEVVEVSMPSLPLALAVYYIICPAEVSSNLSRYDGQRFGFSAKDVKDIDESYKKSRSQGFGSEAKRRIMIGAYVLSSGYYDAYYKRAQTVRTKLINEFKEAFSNVDFLLGPTAPSTAFKIGQNTDDPLKMYLTDIMTVAVNLVGVPAISVPAGEISGLPVGLQLIAPQKKDRELLEMADKTEELLK
ncbi:glutaminyl-tRNA synthase (glutamine-hydrolyzing) subunit A [Candidatus Saccharibacteria bacterium RIFCSPHIGHO2_02_FULL_47_12]|nr:MAG: glutaminyl-tRNA synthase (glutamine-hydrolyzing) subunit A [Candidatus Saccharibacteria bacterium RIFCSPHIGHO2_02_FULL_47_12]